jgi:hypothetical protein
LISHRRLLYEQSVVHNGYLIIPYVYSEIAGTPIYAYRLLCELGHRSPWHRAKNPAGLHSSRVEGILQIAKEHLDTQMLVSQALDFFKQRYIYNHNLIIISEIRDKFFYDHYPPHSPQ